MPIIKSAIKRNKQAQVRRSRNLLVKAAVKADVRAVGDAMATGDGKKAAEAFRAAVSEVDRAVKKGTLHANTAARKKSRLNAKMKATLGTASKPTKVTKTAAPKTAAKAPAKKPASKKTASSK
jgi:small subunit ribosomal protein S20